MSSKFLPRLLNLTIASLILPILFAGCTSVPPQNISIDRMEYGKVVAESWKSQMLLNVVRLRYADTPVLLNITSIINSYSVGGKTSAKIPEPSIFTFGGESSWSNTPTVTYQPMLGDKFSRSILQPIPPRAVFQLLQGGWPVEIVFKTMVSSINGVRNDYSGIEVDADFQKLIEVISRIQRRGDMAIRLSPNDGNTIIIVLRQDEGATEEDFKLICDLLGIKQEDGQFILKYGLLPQPPNVVTVLSRSMLEIMLQLGFGIKLPLEHMADGRALAERWNEGKIKAKSLVNIHSGVTGPVGVYASVLYKGYWYWIDDTDVASKSTFTFLILLSSLAETSQSSSAPTITVPSR